MLRYAVAFYFIFLQVTAFAQCPKVGYFVDGIGGTAAKYASASNYSLDASGILVYDYGDGYGGLGKWPNPFFISRYANGLYADWYRGGCQDQALKEAFMVQAKWFAENVVDKDGMAVWTYPFPNPFFDLDGGWFSGIGQSHIAAVLYRAYVLSGDEHYRDLSERAMKVYLRPVTAGGVVVEGDGGIWIQEAPSPTGTAYDILNGHITGLLGVIDWANMTGDGQYQHVVQGGIDAVRATIHDFDAGFTSFYSLRAPHGDQVLLAPLNGYHNQHIRQLKRLYEIDGDPVFKAMAERFRQYQQRKYIRTAAGYDLEGFRPENADGSSTFWSQSKFPTWFQLDLKDESAIAGIVIKGQDPESTPRDMTVSLRHHGSWREVWSISTNIEQNLYLSFPRPVNADAFRIDIRSDNGGNNVELNLVVPVLSDTPGTDDDVRAEQAVLRPGFMAGTK